MNAVGSASTDHGEAGPVTATAPACTGIPGKVLMPNNAADRSTTLSRYTRLSHHGPRGVSRWAIALSATAMFSVLFVGWEVLERHLLPDISVGMSHFLLTTRAVAGAALACTLVYVLMIRHQRRLSDTAAKLTNLLESYTDRKPEAHHFENPRLAHCRTVLNCARTQCPMYDAPGERCWQVVALRSCSQNNGAPSGVTINQCHDCKVYRMSCPDNLTELGEAFNNLMFLLEEEAKQVKVMRSQMLEKEKMVAIGQMAAGVAHEVGNPLSSISAIAQMLKRSKAPDLPTEQLDLIEMHIKRIMGTVRQLISLARPEPEGWELTDIGQTLDDAVKLISFDRRAKPVDIHLKRTQVLPASYALRGQLQQVFINLLLNALDAMPDGGTLNISVAPQKKKRYIDVRIQDTGHGISNEAGRRIFEPFFTTKQPGQGTGLGLSVSYGIVQKHGGSIDFESSPGEGTTFTVQLPILHTAPDTQHGTTNDTTGRR